MDRALKIGILGTRGIPNRYGGFEQCAEKLALGLVGKGHNLWVYNSHNHEYKESEWRGIHIIHCKDPEHKIGTFGQFVYDLNCINDARERDFDVLLQLGYTSNSIWYSMWPTHCKNVVNMDGLEWKRSKYNKFTRLFLKYAEKLAATHGDLLISDSTGIQQYLSDTYKKSSVFIPYGADIFANPHSALLNDYNLVPFNYYLLIARMEPENNVEMIIKGIVESKANKPLIVIGKTENKYGQFLNNKYGGNDNVKFLGGIYNNEILNNLRYFSLMYFHGHSVGGTNPSLLEAMGCHSLIAAHNNVFNNGILGPDALYFSDYSEISSLISEIHNKDQFQIKLQNNVDKIMHLYNWEIVTDSYEAAFASVIN